MVGKLDEALTFVVPGVMGSSLRYCGVGDHGELIDELVWGGSFADTVDLLATHPARLGLRELKPDAVIEWLNGPVTKPLYGPLVAFCKSKNGLGLQEGNNLFPFPYDWRSDNRQTAERLADFIREKGERGTRKIYLIAHSMGGIVCRLMLLADESIASRVEILFQVATPIQGSASAFDTLRRHPRFHWFLDIFWTLSHRLNVDQRARLATTLSGFPSLYQLLPPAVMVTLRKEDGAQYPAVHRDAWPTHLHTFLEGAEEVHRLLAQPVGRRIRCVYTAEHPTPSIYLVNRDWDVMAEQRIDALGDGTVTCASAYASSEAADRRLIRGKAAKHAELQHHPEVLQLLREAFSE